MKKLLLVGMLLISTVAFSQVEKGDISATANVNFSSQMPSEGDPMNMSTIYIRGGYFFTDNVEAGLSVNLSIIGADGENIVGTGFGPYAVYNFLTDNGKLLPYVGANFINFNAGIEGVDPINQIGGFGGFKYFVTEAVNIDTSLNYTSWLGDVKGASLSLNIGVGINLGALN